MFKKVVMISILTVFISCNNSISESELKEYKLIGKKYAISTKKVLGKNLLTQIQNEGPIAALKFCNSKAYPLTDSMSVVHNAIIKRVSDRPRNPKNLANADEIQQIESFKEMLLNKQQIEPFIKEEGDKIIFSAPIITDGVCLQCHGRVRREMHPAVFKAINELYPEDKAIGYDVNQVRGIWKITFQKSKGE